MKIAHSNFCGYMVYRSEEGSASEFLGRVETMQQARALVRYCHTTGAGLPESEYDTAHAAGHCMGIRSPQDMIDDNEVTDQDNGVWFGPGEIYVAVSIYKAESDFE